MAVQPALRLTLIATAAFVFAVIASGVPAQPSPAQASAAAQPAARPAGARFAPRSKDVDFDNHDGWTRIFDGKSLTNWDGPTDIWHVEDGAIVGESTPEHPSGTTNIIWRGGQPANFELKLEIKLEGAGANGGVQYRSLNVPPNPPVTPPDRLAQMTDEQKQRAAARQALAEKYAKWSLKGYQADCDYNNVYTGQMYEQGTGRGIIAWRGQMIEALPGGKKQLVGNLEDADALKAYLKPNDWNQYEIIADGNTLTHIVNGHVMSILVDNDPAIRQMKGLIGLEIEGGGTVKISHRNIWLKELP